MRWLILIGFVMGLGGWHHRHDRPTPSSVVHEVSVVTCASPSAVVAVAVERQHLQAVTLDVPTVVVTEVDARQPLVAHERPPDSAPAFLRHSSLLL